MYTSFLTEEFELLKEFILKDKKIIVFGTGDGAVQVTNNLPYEVDYYVDNDSNKWGDKFLGKTTCSPDILAHEKKGDFVVLVASIYYVDISIQLTTSGLHEGIDFFNGLRMFEGYNSNKLAANADKKFQGMSISRGIDPTGRVMLDKINKKAYRGIYKDFQEPVLEIYDKCKQGRLLGSYIIATKVLDISPFKPFDLVLEHEYIDIVTYPQEWSPLMFQKATRVALDFLLQLDNQDLYFQDPHPGNFVLHNGNFICIDFGAIRKKSANKRDLGRAIKEFVNRFMNPLILMSKGLFQHTSAFISNRLEVNGEFLLGHMKTFEKDVYIEEMNLVELEIELDNISSVISRLRSIIDQYNIQVDPAKLTYYHLGESLKSERELEFMKRAVDRISPKSLLFLGKDIPNYCAEFSDVPIAIADNDQEYIDIVFMKYNGNGVLPIVLDFIAPTPSYALFSTYDLHYTLYKPMDSDESIPPILNNAKQRLQSELVICRSLLQYLVFFRQLNFDDFVKQLSFFTSCYVLIDFIHPKNEILQRYIGGQFSWYHYDHFFESVTKYFEVIEVEEITSTRSLLFCKKPSPKG
jgi:Predicted unusual protein kinase